MLVSESWVREWADPEIPTDELSEILTLAGLEVDAVSTAGPALDNKKIVTGRIVSVEDHPGAPKLKLCKVSTGGKKLLPIVCGAANVREGLVTAVAETGAKIGKNTIAGREIRGELSRGMLCSAMELGLDEAADGIIEFDADAELGVGVAEYLDLQDRIWALKLTPNRGDCLSIAGAAREIATLTRTRLKTPRVDKVKPTAGEVLDIRLEAPDGCCRYVGRAVIDIDMTAKTPDWMAERLRRSGMRSINPIVDVTNYVMQELGQPMHAFDMSKIRGGILVRRAAKGEKLKLLDGRKVSLKPHNLVIADHEKAVALAGIMGGAESAISDRTRDIYLESAYFSADDMLGKAREFEMDTDASHRYERGVDSELQVKAMERATQLILNIAGGRAGPVTHAVNRSYLPRMPTIRFYRSEISRILGVEIPAGKVTEILRGLGMNVSKNGDGWKIKPPSWRFDIRGQHDLVEEVGRCYGYEKIPPRLPGRGSRSKAYRENALNLNQIKDTLIEKGYHESITYSFVDPDLQNSLLGDKRKSIALSNPIADNMSVMRQSIWPGLLTAMKNNLNRQESRVRLFEVGHVFKSAKNDRKSIENNLLGGIVTGDSKPSQWGEEAKKVDFFDVKGDLEAVLSLSGNLRRFKFRPGRYPALHPGQCAEIVCGKKVIGYAGKLSPDLQKSFEIRQDVYLFEIDLSYLKTTVVPKFTEVSRYPSVQRDLAVVVDQDVEVQSVLDLIYLQGGELLNKLVLFDIYSGNNIEKNKKSLAFSLIFQSESSNLTSVEVETVTQAIIALLEHKAGAQLRK